MNTIDKSRETPSRNDPLARQIARRLIESHEGFRDAHFTSEKVSFITDEIIVQRYVEIEGEIRRVMAVIKMRGSDHSHEFRLYEVTATGAVIGGSLTEYNGIITGVPTLRTKQAKAKRGR